MIACLEPAGLLLGRCALATLFLHEAWAKLTNYDGAVRYTEAFGLPGFALAPAIALELVGGVLILTGVGARIAAFLLSGFCVVTGLIFHSAFGDRNQLLHFEKDLAIAGGFLILCVSGPGSWTLARYWTGRGAARKMEGT